MTEHKEDSLPRWAQDRLEALRDEIRDRDRAIAKLKEAHSLLFDSTTWFTVSGPTNDTTRSTYRLWMLDRDEPIAVCALGPNDRLLVGRFGKGNS